MSCSKWKHCKGLERREALLVQASGISKWRHYIGTSNVDSAGEIWAGVVLGEGIIFETECLTEQELLRMVYLE